MADANIAQSVSEEFDFGEGTERVELALDATSKAYSLVSLLMREVDPNNLMDCMDILGLKLLELFDAQYSALTDGLATVQYINAQLGIKDAAHV